MAISELKFIVNHRPINLSTSIYYNILNSSNNMPTTEELKHVGFNTERDLNSHQAKQGRSKKSDSST